MTWNGATFSHPQFPINNGAHDNLSCQSCHMVPSNYSSFSCIHCHEHNQSNTNNDHDRVSGYTYVSSACYSCHPDGDD